MSNTFKLILLALIALILAFCMSRYVFKETINTRGMRCNMNFAVLDIDHEDSPGMASDLLCEVNSKVQRFIKHLRFKYTCQNEKVKKLDKYYQHTDLVESRDETYTENKLRNDSAKIYVCMRDVKTGKLYSPDLILFVIIHELTHVIDPNWNVTSSHSHSFWVLNSRMLLEAKEAGLFPRGFRDYSIFPIDYCNGVKINNNPALDRELVGRAKEIVF